LAAVFTSCIDSSGWHGVTVERQERRHVLGHRIAQRIGVGGRGAEEKGGGE
jgi:hypothetical protein